jgi:hypothetical protein
VLVEKEPQEPGTRYNLMPRTKACEGSSS